MTQWRTKRTQISDKWHNLNSQLPPPLPLVSPSSIPIKLKPDWGCWDKSTWDEWKSGRKGKSSWQYPSGGPYPGQLRAPGSLRRFYIVRKKGAATYNYGGSWNVYTHQNGIWSSKIFPLLKNLYYSEHEALPLITIIFYCKVVVKQDHCMAHLMSKENSVF